jgi:hypothetical protein
MFVYFFVPSFWRWAARPKIYFLCLLFSFLRCWVFLSYIHEMETSKKCFWTYQVSGWQRKYGIGLQLGKYRLPSLHLLKKQQYHTTTHQPHTHTHTHIHLTKILTRNQKCIFCLLLFLYTQCFEVAHSTGHFKTVPLERYRSFNQSAGLF